MKSSTALVVTMSPYFFCALLIVAVMAPASPAVADGPCTNYRGSSKACYCPSGQRPTVFSLVCSYYVDNSGNQCSAESCMGACTCENISQAQTNRQERPIRRETPEDDSSTQAPSTVAPPTDAADFGQYWKPNRGCLQDLRQFNREAPHGAFAVPKMGGGCGWSVDAEGSKPAATIRREALAQCARYGADCKVVSER
jgi:hypothetical protein